MTSTHHTIPKVGFDLDGVLLYNPIRTIRPLVAAFKKQVLKKKKTRFYYPKTPREQAMFRWFHKTSMFTAPGFDDLVTLTEKKLIEPYLVTARFDYLKQDLDAWVKRVKGEQIFKGIYHNQRNQQPHLFKAEMVKKLNLDIFVEDNWDIVHHLNQTHNEIETKTQILWITNLVDTRFIDYPHKFLTFGQAMKYLTQQVNQH